MNEKNFVEELKQKRGEYCVSKTRFEVAFGISREHYNCIEKGKLLFTEELKETMTVQRNAERIYRKAQAKVSILVP